MQTFGRDADGLWFEVTTDENGYNDDVYLTTLAQVLQSDINESWFYPKLGIPGRQSAIGRTHPDYFVGRVKNYFAQYFDNINVVQTIEEDTQNPVYYVDVIKNDGSIYKATIYV